MRRSKTQDREYARNYRRTKQDPMMALIYEARKRAKIRGRAHSITLKEIYAVLPADGRCPYCDANMERHTRHAPSLDEIIVGRGYISGNVNVICRHCNSHKNNYSVEWFDRVAARMRKAEQEATV